MRHLRSRAVPVLAFLLLSSGAVTAQERSGPDPAKPQEPEITLPEVMGRNPDQEKMVELFHAVERTLAAIDVELADAGAGEVPLPEGKDSGIERLLRGTTAKCDQAVAGIDEILALAAKMNPKGGGKGT